MNATRIITLSAILAAAVNVAWATDGQYQPGADSTGATSRAKGELSVMPVRAAVAAGAPRAAKYQPEGDSTGGSSRLRGELVES